MKKPRASTDAEGLPADFTHFWPTGFHVRRRQPPEFPPASSSAPTPSQRSTLQPSPGFFRWARQATSLDPRLTPTIVRMRRASPSPVHPIALTHPSPEVGLHNKMCVCARASAHACVCVCDRARWVRTLQPEECTPTATAPEATCGPSSSPVSWYWPTKYGAHPQLASTSSCASTPRQSESCH